MNLLSLPHLAGRWAGSLRVRRPGPADQARVAALLGPHLTPMFFDQQAIDQHHALSVARRAAEAAPNRPDLVLAALLHDIGKRHSSLGISARVAASLLTITRLPVIGRWRLYLDHGRLGADDLTAAGAPPLAVAFARDHHRGEAPAGVDPADWATLRRADGE